MLKFGVVSATDPSTCRVRVRYQDNEGIESYWLAVTQRQAYGTVKKGYEDSEGDDDA